MSDASTVDNLAGPARHRALTIALWVLQVLLALMFVMAGLMKLAGPPDAVAMFDLIGFGQWFRYFTGAVEVAGGIGVLIPALAGLAGMGLVCVMIGALITQLLVIGGSPVLPIVLLLMAALVAWGRWPQTTRLVGKPAKR